MYNPYEAPAENNHPRGLSSGRLRIGLVLLSSLYGVLMAFWISASYFLSDGSLLSVYYGIGFLFLLLLLWNCRRRRIVYNALFWLMAFIFFVAANYCLRLGLHLNHMVICALLVLLPFCLSEVLFVVLNWFRRHWSKRM